MGMIRSWRRKRILARTRIDEATWRHVTGRLPFLRGLSADELGRLRELAVVFLAEKEMHGAGGFQLTDEVRLSIAVQACLLVLNLDIDWYDGWVGIVVYPGEFRVQKEEMDEHGVVHAYDEGLSGEAWAGGPVVLSWEDIGMAETGYNVVIHEFAHKLHMLHGDEEGFPAPGAGMDALRWHETLAREYERFCAAVDSGEPTIVDEYGADHPAEFFAVMSETFFTDSGILARDFPDLYGQLSLYYRQDPAGMIGGS